MNKYVQAICEYLKSKAYYAYEDPRTGEVYYYKRKGVHRKNGRVLVLAKNSDTYKE